MKITPFHLERYFAQHEFSAPYLLSASDAEALAMKELLGMADDQALALWEALSLGYTESQGHPLLLSEIATMYRGVNADGLLEVIPEEGIFIAMSTLLSPGDHVIVSFPGYQSLYAIAEGMGCEVSRWEPDAEMRFHVGVLESLLTADTKMIVVNFPHNPTGALITKSEQQEILDLAAERGITIFSDEMYRMLEYDPHLRLPPACDLYENTVSLSGLSKSFALPGLRTGWLATRNQTFLKQFARFKDYTTICASAPGEVLALMSLRAKDRILKRNQEIIQSNLALLDDFFDAHADRISWTRPLAGTVAFPRWLGKAKVKDFCADLLKKKGVLLVPADVFEYGGPHFRLGFGRRNMPEALNLLDEYLSAQK